MRILLADLSYERVSPSPLPVPMAIGCLTGYANTFCNCDPKIELVRTIEGFIRTFDVNEYDMVGFSNYVWNSQLSKLMASRVKAANRNCITVFGGPNLPIDPTLQEAYVLSMPQVDFTIEKEGESPFVRLIDACAEQDFNVKEIKALRLPSVRSVLDGEFLSSPLDNRILDLDRIPSPYLSGMMDEFLETGFTPILENNRGCPFSCAFCGEGDVYHSKVAKHSTERLKKEYEYVANKMSKLRHLEFSEYLYFSDSNTGMYRQDIELAQHIGEIQERFDWPEVIITSTGKNLKERIIEFVSLLNGAMTLTASVQSTDPEVLANVLRENVSTDVLTAVSTEEVEQVNTYSEIILGLPGDTFERHLKTIKDMMANRISQLSIVQLMILPDTPMLSAEYISRFGLDLRYRILCKGVAQIEDEGVVRTVAETELICVGNQDMSFDEYVKARVVGLLVVIFYNKLFVNETFDCLDAQQKSPMDYILSLYAAEWPDSFATLIDEFIGDLGDELYKSPEEIDGLLAQENSYELLKTGEIGKNLTSYYSKRAFGLPKILTQMAEDAAKQVGGSKLSRLIVEDIERNIDWRKSVDSSDQLAQISRTKETNNFPRDNADLANF